MKKHLLYILNDFNLIYLQRTQILILVALSLLFSFFVGWSYNSGMQPDLSIDPFTLSIENLDQGNYGELLVDYFQDKSITEIIEIVEVEADFNLIIKENYSQNLENTHLIVEKASDASTTHEKILLQILERIQNQFVEDHRLQSIQSEQGWLNNLKFAQDINAINQLFLRDIYIEEEADIKAALSGFQYAAVTFGMLYIILMVGQSQTGLVTREEFSGLSKRLKIIPFKYSEIIPLSIITNTILASIQFLLYYFFVMLFDSNIFSGNPVFYFTWYIIYSLFIITFFNLMIEIVPDQYVQWFGMFTLLIYLIFFMFPSEAFNSEIISFFLENNLLRQVFNKPIFDYMLYGKTIEYLPIAITLIALTIFMMVINIWICNRKEAV